jgi:hypothetical protein
MNLVPNLIVVDPDYRRLWVITQSGVCSFDSASAAILGAREPTQVRPEFTQHRLAAAPPVVVHHCTVSRGTDIIACVVGRAAVGETGNVSGPNLQGRLRRTRQLGDRFAAREHLTHRPRSAR